MMNFIKKIVSLILAAFFISFSSFSINAETVYVYNGYSFTQLNDNCISLCGWDNSSDAFIVPAKIGDYKVTDISNYGLKDNTFITSLDFSSAQYLSSIGSMAFKGCTGICGNLYIPAQVQYVGLGAFQECSLIDTVYYSKGPEVIPVQCFNRCTSLTEVIISDGVLSIEKLAFANCTSLNKVRIPESVDSIDSTAFNNDPNVVIYCYTKSYAHQYAIDNEIPYVLIDYNERYFLHGDIDGDGDIGISDVTLLQRIIAHMVEPDAKMAQRADVNLDDDYNIMDATILQRHIAHIETGLGIGVDFLEYTD